MALGLTRRSHNRGHVNIAGGAFAAPAVSSSSGSATRSARGDAGPDL